MSRSGEPVSIDAVLMVNSTEEAVGLAQFHHLGLSRLMEGGRREDQDRGVDGQREGEGKSGVERREAQRFSFLGERFAIGSRLDDG